MKVRAHYKAKNPFHPNPAALEYTKTVDVADDTDMTWLEEMAKEDTHHNYKFDKLEIVKEEDK